MMAHDCGVMSSVLDNVLRSLDGSGSRVTSYSADDVDLGAACDLVCSLKNVGGLLLTCVFDLFSLLLESSLVFVICLGDGLNDLLCNLGGDVIGYTLHGSDRVEIFLLIVLSEYLLKGPIEIVLLLKFDGLG